MITIEYDGTVYAGWQKQKNALAIQELLERAIFETTGKKTAVFGAGRTDAGVHALGQRAHFDLETKIPVDKLPYVLNLVLPEDVRVKEAVRVDNDFNVRRNAWGKHYRYIVHNAPHACALNRFSCAHVRQPLDVEKMKIAAQYIKGRHDFKAFQAAGSAITETVRTIYSIQITAIENEIYIDVIGNGFLYHMVRILAGTLIDVGKGRIPPKQVKEILASCNREKAGPTAPAKGLILMDVFYAPKSV